MAYSGRFGVKEPRLSEPISEEKRLLYRSTRQVLYVIVPPKYCEAFKWAHLMY